MEARHDHLVGSAWVAATGAAGLAASPVLLLWDRLPEPIAVRWSLTGAPDGPMPKALFLALCCAILALLAWAASRQPSDRSSRADAWAAIGCLAFGCTLLPSIATLCVALNVDRAAWQHALPLTPVRAALSLMPSTLASLVTLAVRAMHVRRRSSLASTALKSNDQRIAPES